MPSTGAAIDVVGVVTLTLALLLCLAGAFCVAYVLYFHHKVGKERRLVLRDFDSPWVVRIVLVGFSISWGLCELLRLPLLRRKGWLLHGLDFAWQANLCRFHVVSSIGFWEAGFFLTALFLVHWSLHSRPYFSRILNCRALTISVISCLPLFLLQLLVVVTSSSFQFQKAYNETNEGYGGILPSYFTRSFVEADNETDGHLALCTYPFFSVLLLALFGLVFVVLFCYLGLRMLHLAINRQLRTRIYVLLLVVGVFLPVHVLFLGISVRSKPGKPVHEILRFIGFLTLLLCTLVGEWILVVLPIGDALAVHFLFENRLQSYGTSPLETLGSSMAVFSSDDEVAPQVARQSFLGSHISSSEIDSELSNKEFALTFGRKLLPRV
eukprot:c23344_g1_i1 orf=274-1416(-)